MATNNKSRSNLAVDTKGKAHDSQLDSAVPQEKRISPLIKKSRGTSRRRPPQNSLSPRTVKSQENNPYSPKEGRDDVEHRTQSLSSKTSPREKSSPQLTVNTNTAQTVPSSTATSPIRSPRSTSSRTSKNGTSPRRKNVTPKENTNDHDNNNQNQQQSTPAPDAQETPAPVPDSPRTHAQKKLFHSLREPDRSLKELLLVLNDESTSLLRRVNACGAVKTLTLNKSNQLILARTRGVVSSITSALCRVEASEEERMRCIHALMHLSMPEKNWRVVYLFPQTPEALARNMADRYPRIRYAACMTMSFLSKVNREEVVQHRIVMFAIARVLEVDKNGALERVSMQDRKVFVASRLCILKMLLQLSKNKDVSVPLARVDCVMDALVNIANRIELAANILCVAILTNLSRHPENSVHMVFHVKRLLPTLVEYITGMATVCGDGADSQESQECAKCALYTLQNLSCENKCRQELANTPNLLAALTKNAFKTQDPEHQYSALNTLKNLSDDPFNLVTMTNTPGCTATLLALANDGNNVMAQYLACDTLATLSHWLSTLSAAKNKKGRAIGEGEEDTEEKRRTFQTLTWEMWN